MELLTWARNNGSVECFRHKFERWVPWLHPDWNIRGSYTLYVMPAYFSYFVSWRLRKTCHVKRSLYVIKVMSSYWLADKVHWIWINVRADLLQYIGQHYQPHQIYLAAAGGVDHAELVKLAEKHFGDMQTTHVSEIEYPPARYTGSWVRLNNFYFNLNLQFRRKDWMIRDEYSSWFRWSHFWVDVTRIFNRWITEMMQWVSATSLLLLRAAAGPILITLHSWLQTL